MSVGTSPAIRPGDAMRRVEIHHVDVEENCDWPAIQAIMDEIEFYPEAPTDFTIYEKDSPQALVYVALAEIPDRIAWLLCKPVARSNFFLSHGDKSEREQCIYLG